MRHQGSARWRPSRAVDDRHVDHFKQVNDIWGYQIGDKVLAAAAGAILHAIRPDDIAVRFGGEEFVVLLADIELHAAQSIAERIRASIAQTGEGSLR